MIELRTFGRLDLTAPDPEAARGILVHPKRAGLLVYLALAQPRGFHRRDALVALFWPELDQDRARAALRKTLHYLRRALGAGALESRGDDEVRLAEGSVWCDAVAFEADLEAGHTIPALEKYQGALLEAYFLPDTPDFERWMERERSRLHRRAFDAAWALADREERSGNRFGAAHWGRRALGLIPDDESALTRLLALLDRLGDRAGAVQAYEDFARRLKVDFDAEPSAETQALARAIRARAPSGTEAGSPAPALLPVPPPRPSLPNRHRGRRRSLARLVGALMVISGSWTGLETAGVPLGRQSNIVAVFPFAVLGEPSLAYVGEGAPALLSTGLDGAGDLRSIHPRALARPEAAAPTPEQAQRTAEILGAGMFVTGDVVATGSRLRISASLFRVDPPGHKLETAMVEGPADSLFALVDQLTARLIAAGRESPARGVARLAARTTHSIPALKAYLEGEWEFQRGTFPRAIAGYQRAIALDTAFALAYYRLAQAYTWSAVDSSRWAAEQAARYGERLPPPERELVEAFLHYERGDADDAERRYREILRRRPEEVDAIFNLGEVLFHFNPSRGRPVAEAGDFFRRAYAMNDGEAPLIHLLEIAALEREYGTFDSLLSRIVPGSHFWWAGRMVRAVELGREADRRKIEDELRQVPGQELATVGAHALYLLEDGEAAAGIVRLMDSADRPPAIRLTGRLLLAHLLMGGGRWREALGMLDSAARLDPLLAAEHAGLLFSTPGLPLPDTALSQVRAWLDAVDPEARPFMPAGEERLAHADRLAYVRGLLSARMGRHDVSLAQAALLARRPPTPRHSALASSIRAYSGMLGRNLSRWEEGLLATEAKPEVLDRGLDAPFLGFRLERMVRAEWLVHTGQTEMALGWLAAPTEHSAFGRAYLAPSLYRRGELLERLGRGREAAAAYLRVSRLWQHADPEFQPMVAEVRGRAARLAGSLRPR